MKTVLNYMKLKLSILSVLLTFYSLNACAMSEDVFPDDSGGGEYSDQGLQSNEYEGRYEEDFNRNQQSFDDNRSRSRDNFERKHGASLNEPANQIASPAKFREEQDKILNYKGRIKTLKDKIKNGTPTVEDMKILIQTTKKLGEVYINRAIRLLEDKAKLDTYIKTAKAAVQEGTLLINSTGTLLKEAEKSRKARATTFAKNDNKAKKTNFDVEEQKEREKAVKSRTTDPVFKSFDKAVGTAEKQAATVKSDPSSYGSGSSSDAYGSPGDSALNPSAGMSGRTKPSVATASNFRKSGGYTPADRSNSYSGGSGSKRRSSR